MKLNRYSRTAHDPWGLHRRTGSICYAAGMVGLQCHKVNNNSSGVLFDRTKNHEFTQERFINNKRSIEKTRP